MDLNEIISTYGLFLAYILLAVAALAAVVLPLISALNNPKSLLKTLGAVVVLLIVFGIAYSISGGEVLESYQKHGVNTAGASKFVGGTLFTLYALIIFAIIAIVVTEIKKAFN
jgi:ribose/xylose/arabinose/galactoside ABC-type transport system permease subunit